MQLQSMLYFYNRYMQEAQTLFKKLGTEKLSQAEEVVLLLHCCNLTSKLQCLKSEESTEECQLPEGWNKDIDQVYSFVYRMPNNKRVLFKFVSNPKTINVNFVVQETGLLHETIIDIGDSHTQIVDKYSKFLETIVKRESTKTSTPSLRPVLLQPDSSSGRFDIPRPPIPVPIPPSFRPQFGGEYVGPDHSIFRGGNVGPNIPNMSVPFGARYDPTNPFDDPFGQGQIGGLNRGGSGNGEFFGGFDSFGRPQGGGFGGGGFGGGGFNPGRFL